RAMSGSAWAAASAARRARSWRVACWEEGREGPPRRRPRAPPPFKLQARPGAAGGAEGRAGREAKGGGGRPGRGPPARGRRQHEAVVVAVDGAVGVDTLAAGTDLGHEVTEEATWIVDRGSWIVNGRGRQRAPPFTLHDPRVCDSAPPASETAGRP